MSTHPGKIEREITILLPEHRDLDIKLSPEFIEIKRQINHLLRF
jgi:NitT/TauT family transport system ATP-binding protein